MEGAGTAKLLAQSCRAVPTSSLYPGYCSYMQRKHQISALCAWEPQQSCFIRVWLRYPNIWLPGGHIPSISALSSLELYLQDRN